MKIRLGDFIEQSAVLQHHERFTIATTDKYGAIKRYFTWQIMAFDENSSMLKDALTNYEVENHVNKFIQGTDELSHDGEKYTM